MGFKDKFPFEPTEHLRILNRGNEKVLQQKWVNHLGDSDWREIPEVLDPCFEQSLPDKCIEGWGKISFCNKKNECMICLITKEEKK